MEAFKEVLEELTLVDIKPTRGWFTWINNRDGNALVKERLDRLVMSSNSASIFPFIDAVVVRQTKSDHDTVLLDTLGKKPKEKRRDPRLAFRYNVCWAKDKREKEIIKNKWCRKDENTLEKIDGMHEILGPWQFKKYNKMKAQISVLAEHIDRIIDGPTTLFDMNNRIFQIAGDYFQNLFTSSIDYNDEVEMNYISMCVDQGINNMLVKDFTDEEILAAFNRMDPRKAPGIDGLSGVFFRENWKVVVKDILNFCHDFFKRLKRFCLYK
ncbi:hypothetical protein GOBAR_AA00996 [Gossypium barbadense]|uniref:Reverse transcriptase domain-containing protein n=1 Tax=Gossypium barbadense TaxID=3634 RepID=A0A2P5YVD9_GOSBA|nr:hypothetical protein GOBAR_AA00996 [Gossypium barbadense]